MTPREFFDKVAAMRDAQKKYFKSRSRFDLDAAKRLEKEIDNEIARVAAYCLHVRLGLCYSTIGRMLGGRCHATIIYACHKVGSWVRLPQLNRHAVGFITKLTDKTAASN